MISTTETIVSSKIHILPREREEMSKLVIRQAVWKYFQEHDLANFPHSVYRRIPNFKGADEAAAKLAALDCFKDAKSVKVNLDKPQGDVRYLTLEQDKTLLVPTPGLRTGLFNSMTNTSAGENTPENLKLLSQNDGMKKHSKSLQLEDEAKVDLIVVGSVAVSKTGQRIGKGEGFVDLEYGMMRQMKCVTDKTLIVTTVHDVQVFDTLPDALFGPHDVPVDIIVTPTEVIRVATPPPKPTGILWKLLQADKFLRVAILRKLWQMEKDAGGDVTLATDSEPVPTEDDIVQYWQELEAKREASREARASRRGTRGRRGGMRRGRGRGRRGGYSGGEGEEMEDEDGKDIQVTVNMNKRNRIVRRTVKSANMVDRDAIEAQDEEDGGEMRGRGRGRGGRMRGRRGRGFYGGPPPFSIFLGNVPSFSRTREIKEAVKDVIDKKAQGVDIQRRTQAGYAFLRFNRLGEEHADELVDSLQGLKILDQEVTVEKAHSRSPGEENGDGEEGESGFRGGRGGRRGGKRYRGARRGRGGPGGYGEDRRRRRDDDEEEAEENGEEGEQFHEAKE